MRDIDKREFQELKRRRQQQYKTKKSADTNEGVIPTVTRSAGEDIAIIRRDSNKRKESLITDGSRMRRAEIQSDDDDYDYMLPNAIGYGSPQNHHPQHNQNYNNQGVPVIETEGGELKIAGLKIGGIYQAVMIVFGIVVAIITGWVNFDATVKSNTARITAIEEELSVSKKSNSDMYSVMVFDIDRRLKAIEKDFIPHISESSAKRIQMQNEIDRLRFDVERLRISSDGTTKDITSILRNINSLESQIRKIPK